MNKIVNYIFVTSLIFTLSSCSSQLTEKATLRSITKIYNLGNFEAAKKELKAFTKKHPKSSQGWQFYGLVNLELADTTNAELGFKKAYEIDKNNDKAVVGLGVVQRMKGMHKEAKELYEKALSMNPKNADAYSSLLMLELKNKNYQKAVELGEKAESLRVTESSLGILGNLAIAYHLNNEFDKRDEILKQLKNKNYRDLEYIMMLINGTLTIDDIM